MFLNQQNNTWLSSKKQYMRYCSNLIDGIGQEQSKHITLHDMLIFTPVLNQMPSKIHLVMTHQISRPQQFPGFRSATITIPYRYTLCGLRGLFSQLARKNVGRWAPCRASSCQPLVKAMSSSNCYYC